MPRSEQGKRNCVLSTMRYQKVNLRRYNLSLNRITESDLIEFLETKQPYATYIKQLIREDMKKSN